MISRKYKKKRLSGVSKLFNKINRYTIIMNFLFVIDYVEQMNYIANYDILKFYDIRSKHEYLFANKRFCGWEEIFG